MGLPSDMKTGWYKTLPVSNAQSNKTSSFIDDAPNLPAGSKLRVYHVGRELRYSDCTSFDEAQNFARIGCIFNGVGAAYIYSVWGCKWWRISYFMASHGRSAASIVNWQAEDLPAVVKTMEMLE